MITVGIYGIADTSQGDHPTHTHDHSIALMRAGQVLTVVQLERYTGRKHDNRLGAFVGELLERYVPADEPVRFVSVNSFVGSSFASTDGNLRIEPCGPVEIAPGLTPARVRWHPAGLRPREARGYVICHEFAHLASVLPFVGRLEPDSLLVHIDGGASDSACSFWYYDGRRVELIEHSWSRLKDVVNNFNASPLARAILRLTPRDHLSMPGKLMGFAGYGQVVPALIERLEQHRWFLDFEGDEGALLRRVNHVLEARLERFNTLEPLCRDLCAAMQAHFEAEVARMILEMQRRTGARTLYYAGGAALNIPTNTRLEASGVFRAVHIPPCTNDTGLALGAAAWLEYIEQGELSIQSPFLNRFDVPTDEPDETDLGAVAELIARGGVLGICNGAAEIGPRALGHRSIVARPDSSTLRRRVSEEIKRREWYRPVGPVLCEEVVREALGPEVASSPLAPYMLGAYRLQKGWKQPFAGVLHEDGTLRAQVVSTGQLEQGYLHRLLMQLWREYGIAGLINTSFNIQGEPIVHHHDVALEAGRRMGLDGVVVQGILKRG